MTFHAKSWERAWRGVGAQGDGLAVHAELVARYQEPHRAYHSLQHLDECLQAFETVQSLPEHPGYVELALWFHDAIYDVHRSDNEELSAQWVASALVAAGAAPASAQRVGDLVLATQHTALPTGTDASVLIDIDLAILGAAQPRFEEYEAQIKTEYAFVSATAFATRRRAVLASFLARPRIYNTPYFYAALEERARRNLQRSIDALNAHADTTKLELTSTRNAP